MSDSQEVSTIVAAQSGNQTAFGQLVQKYQNLVTSIAYSKTGDLQRSEDIAQQTFLIAWQKREELNEPKRFRGWLRSIARNVTLNSNRKSNHLDRSAASITSSDEPVSLDTPSSSLSFHEQQELLWSSLKNIPDEYREPLVLFYREDQSVQQVADQLELSKDAVKQRLSRGRAMLKNEVEQFVEDMLSASKPSTTFASAVIAMIPLATAKGNVVAQGSALGSEVAMGKSSSLTPALGIWAGVFGAICGLKIVQKHATSVVEKNSLYRFQKIAIFTTAILASSAIFMIKEFDATTRFYLIASSIIYAVIMAGLTVFFVQKQRREHRIHGKPKFTKELKEITASTPTEYRSAVLKATLACWAWIVMLAIVHHDWTMLMVSVVVMTVNLAWRIRAANSVVTIPGQMRFQAITLLINFSLTAILCLIAGIIETPLNYAQIPNWQVSLFVFVFALFVTGSTLASASKVEKKLAEFAQTQTQ